MTNARILEIRALCEYHKGKGSRCIKLLSESLDEIERLQRPYSRRKLAKDPPSLSDVLKYAETIGLMSMDDATACFDHYEKVGWVAGKAKIPIQSWQAAVREWGRRGQKWNGTDVKGKVSFGIG